MDHPNKHLQFPRHVLASQRHQEKYGIPSCPVDWCVIRARIDGWATGAYHLMPSIRQIKIELEADPPFVIVTESQVSAID
ncbi:MAG: hypothetical protein JW829_01375 [Pirellulales bacterium]|nr:hypothetical protein [Pirellulales bacterium]